MQTTAIARVSDDTRYLNLVYMVRFDHKYADLTQQIWKTLRCYSRSAASESDEPFYRDVLHLTIRLEITYGRQMDIGRIVPVAGQEIDFRHSPFGQHEPPYFEVAEIGKANNRSIADAEHLFYDECGLVHNLEGLI